MSEKEISEKMQDIMSRIKKRREELDMSYQTLSDKVGISKSTLQRYETGYIKNMPVDKLEDIADALQVSPAYLMGWTDDPHDWERIGNEEGINPPKDYEGSYEDYVKFKINENPEFDSGTEFLPRLTSGELDHLKQYAQLTNQNMQLVNNYTEKLLSLQNMENELMAAHERTDIKVTEEMRQHDDDIMNDENF